MVIASRSTGSLRWRKRAKNSAIGDTVVEGARPLLNIYSVMEVNPSRFPKVNVAGGKAFADFMVSAEAQIVIKTFGTEKFGESLFFPDAGKREEELGR